MKDLLKRFLKNYKRAYAIYLCHYLECCRLSVEEKQLLGGYLASKFFDIEARQIAEKNGVKVRNDPKEDGLFTGTTARNEAKRMRIEWLKLLIQNYES